ncbi:MAG: ABC transporter permease [Anaerolineales bacterium]|nr:ABC transporter permease [Anaerolineales bacterium]
MAKLLEKSLPEPKPQISQQTSNRMISIATISALILTWVIITQNRLVEPLFAPSPTDLWQAFQNLLPNLPGDLVASILRRIVPGFTIGVTVGTLLGIYMAMNQVGRAIFYPIVEILRPLPPLALIPLLILWFGIGYITQILLIAYGIFIIMVINSFEAVRNVPPIYIHAATTLGANRRQIFQRVILPSIVPDIVAGIRVSAAAAFGYDVAAELMGAMTGLGYRLVLARRYLLTQNIVVILIIIAILSFTIDFLIKRVDAKVTNWKARVEQK